MMEKFWMYMAGTFGLLFVGMGITCNLQASKSRMELALKEKEIAELRQTLTGYETAAQYQQQALAAATVSADKDRKRVQQLLADLQAKPMPTSPEAARLWALDALGKDKR